jgi:predicted DNA-binding protein
MNEEKQQVTIVLPKKHHEELRRLALEKHTSMANLIREAVGYKIESLERKRGRL